MSYPLLEVEKKYLNELTIEKLVKSNNTHHMKDNQVKNMIRKDTDLYVAPQLYS